MIDAGSAQAHLGRLVERFDDLLATADLAAPVSSCPGWTVDDLVRHLGGVYGWARRSIGSPGGTAQPAPGAGRSTLADWYRAVATELRETLRVTDPGQPVTIFDHQRGPAAFWSRRLTHETAVHLWDLGTSVGLDLGYDEELAVDGIDEVVTMFFPRQVALGRVPPLETALALAPSGQDRHWVLSGDGLPLVETAPTVVSGPADALLLAVWGRCGLDDPRLRVRGEPATAAAVLGAGVVP